MGKGSKRRPTNEKSYRANYDQVFEKRAQSSDRVKFKGPLIPKEQHPAIVIRNPKYCFTLPS